MPSSKGNDVSILGTRNTESRSKQFDYSLAREEIIVLSLLAAVAKITTLPAVIAPARGVSAKRIRLGYP